MIIPPHIAAIFWDKVDVRGPDECWPWKAYICVTTGYGRLGVGGGKTDRSHRVAYTLGNGPIPEGESVLHTCDFRPCCNPSHLVSGTQLDNMQGISMVEFREHGRPPTSKVPRDRVNEIRTRKDKGERAVELAQEFGVTPQTIRAIARGAYWPSVKENTCQ